MSGRTGASSGRFTVIVPAHNEEGVIADTLRTFLDTNSADQLDTIVVCNGCTDDTAGEARRAAPSATILELPVASKAEALNAGLAVAQSFPAIVVDADVRISADALAALADVLRDKDVLAASPAVRMDLSGSDRWVCAYYRVWERHPYLASGVGGSGVYGLSREGWEQLKQFPNVTGDDTYVRWKLPAASQRRVISMVDGQPVESMVRPPKTLKGLLACQARWSAGNAQLQQLLGKEAARQRAPNGAKPAANTRDRAVYVGVRLLARAYQLISRFGGRGRQWHREKGLRSAGPTL